MPDAAAAAETVLAGRYRLVRPIARGGMAEVWEGHDVVLDRPVAVKLLHAHLASDETFIERFRREAIAAAGLAHRNVISTYDTGNDKGHAFIVMELVQGQTLAAEIGDGPVVPARAIRIAAEVADALDYAHRAGVVHRDVKPANILLFDDGRVKVSDFGIAKAATGSDLTQTGTMLGTTKYVSPEQVEGKPLDGRSDVYALGVVLYELLCGRPPFKADSDMATALMHVRNEPVPLRRAIPGIPKPLENVVTKAMAKAPAQRFATARDMRDALLRIDVAGGEATAFVPRPDAWRDADEGTRIDRTPPAGIVPSVSRPRRSWTIPVALVTVIAVAIGILVFALSSPDNGGTGAGSGAGATVPISRVTAFDPFGDGAEHNEETANLVDGRANTMWRTQTYRSADLQSVKKGVGLIVEAPGAARHLIVSSANSGWSAQVFTADAPRATFEAWGSPVASRTSISGEVVFDLSKRPGRAVLLWITGLGDGNIVAIRDLRLTS